MSRKLWNRVHALRMSGSTGLASVVFCEYPFRAVMARTPRIAVRPLRERLKPGLNERAPHRPQGCVRLVVLHCRKRVVVYGASLEDAHFVDANGAAALGVIRYH